MNQRQLKYTSMVCRWKNTIHKMYAGILVSFQIIVIKQGKIIEDGTHEALMSVDGTYAHLFRLQAAGYEQYVRTK